MVGRDVPACYAAGRWMRRRCVARQDVVRALVRRDAVDEIAEELNQRFGLPEESIEVWPVEPGTYRDERPDLELHGLVHVSWRRAAVGGLVGALIGVALALIFPVLRELAPTSALLFAFGGAWAGVAVTWLRTVQVKRDEGARPEQLRPIHEQDVDDFRQLTIRVQHDRISVVDHLADRGVALLDTHHPRVDGKEPGARPVDGNDAGPPQP